MGKGLGQWTEDTAGSWRHCLQSQEKKGQEEDWEQGAGREPELPLRLAPLSPTWSCLNMFSELAGETGNLLRPGQLHETGISHLPRLSPGSQSLPPLPSPQCPGLLAPAPHQPSASPY